MAIEIKVKKNFPEFELDVDLHIRSGEFFSIVGPSGCGKSTLLHIISGLLRPDSGKITIDGKNVTDKEAEKRELGYVFQEKYLFLHMNVYENIVFGVKSRGKDEGYAQTITRITHLESLKNRKVGTLSGGEKQRVAIARALAYHPRVLLLDEPLKELDAHIKEEIRREIVRLQKKLRITTIYVTHDLEEAYGISDRIAVMNKGKIEQVERPCLIFKKQKNEFVRQFVSPYRLVKFGKREVLIKKSVMRQ